MKRALKFSSKTAAKERLIINMNNYLDPGTKAAEETQEQQEQATEGTKAEGQKGETEEGQGALVD